MKAYVLRSYGPPDALVLTEVDTPVPGPGEVLVRVRATSVQPYDWHHMRGEPYVARLMGGTIGPRRPRIGILGADVAGQVESVGADEVVDYTKEDSTRSERRHDLLLDIAGTRALRSCTRVLKPRGTHVVVGGPAGRWLQPVGHIIATLAMSPFVSQRVVVTEVSYGEKVRGDLMRLTDLIEDGEVTPVIDRSYPFGEIPAAVAYVEQGHARGKVVVTI